MPAARTRKKRSKRDTGPGPIARFFRWIWGFAMALVLIIFAVSIGTHLLEKDDPGDQISADPALTGDERVTVSVLNGCGETGLAGRVRNLLLDGGSYDVVNVANADDHDYPETLVIDLTGQQGTAEMVADYLQRTLNIGQLIQYRMAEPPAQVIVILGSDASSSGGTSI